jgi:hypothetical protein
MADADRSGGGAKAPSPRPPSVRELINAWRLAETYASELGLDEPAHLCDVRATELEGMLMAHALGTAHRRRS